MLRYKKAMESSPTSPTMNRWKLTIEYDGTKLSGWQRQAAGIVSAQGEVEKAIKGFCQQDINIHGAGRTDAGVHALGQVAHFDLDYGDRELHGWQLVNALNAHLRFQPIAILKAEIVAADFHARFSAKNKLYRYRILSRVAPPVLDENRVWHTRHVLNVDAMNDAAKVLLGTHDFTTFRATECQSKSPIKTLDRLEIFAKPYEGGGTEITIEAEARSFLHHQVRNMAGALLDVGAGEWTKDDLQRALDARDRTKGAETAPSCGLYLVRVDY